MAEPLEIAGISASPGVAVGPAHLCAQMAPVAVEPPNTSAVERQDLQGAIAAAIAELSALAERSDEESAGILDFQIEMLLDPALMEMAEERLAAGDSAALAWVGALDLYIAGIAEAPDEQVRARAVDVIDIRNRVLGALTGRPIGDFPPGSVFVGKDLEPSLFLAHDWTDGGGVVLFDGSVSSHVAMLARTRSIPMVVATGPFEIDRGERVLVDATAATVIVAPDDTHIRKTEARAGSTGAAVKLDAGGLARTIDGAEIRLSAIINDPAELAVVDASSFAGIGLMRTEFLVGSPADALNEERHYAIYREALRWAGAAPVTIRMLDLGGDKTLPGIGGKSSDSFMGLRGVRLLLARPELARVQARALLRAAAHGNLEVLLPMITVPDEIDALRVIFKEEAADLLRRGMQTRMPEIGMMVEVPAAALTLDGFSNAAFFSFGTNDLAQYVMAAARGSSAVAGLYDAAAPVVCRLIAQCVERAKAMKKPIGICGEMASDPRHLPALLAAGLRHFSVAPNCIADVRSAIAGLRSDGLPAAERN
ncbi:Phosphoenolpyruvate-protein phosphotransferase [Ensifer psoraleae]|uniref:putative PEP-binding protein n=1 Tax=Sinorhizobium psoraleae TaxID=520838 RepID=UPI001568E91C|nr:putative PEP-binding protein [Sinorhizobium psoraleae]NRP74415.1 Phosphoenolpyruvate-protein phosphotransferase [Sinorhizobium psoraleae]